MHARGQGIERLDAFPELAKQSKQCRRTYTDTLLRAEMSFVRERHGLLDATELRVRWCELEIRVLPNS